LYPGGVRYATNTRPPTLRLVRAIATASSPRLNTEPVPRRNAARKPTGSCGTGMSKTAAPTTRSRPVPRITTAILIANWAMRRFAGLTGVVASRRRIPFSR
jgi:hypothetical protein